MDAIRQRIARRALVPGDRLPSIRQFARTMQVSPFTVVQAYDRLAAEGGIVSRQGAGFYVTGRDLPPLSLADATTPAARAIDPFWVSRQSLDSDPEVLKPGCGWLPADWMPNEALRRAFRAVARGDNTILSDYGSTRGALRLRRLLTSRFAVEGMEISPDQVVLTGSGTQAVDLICRLLLRRGDTVLVDDPCYFNFQALLRAHEIRIVGVPYTAFGPDIEAFEQIVLQEKPRLYITNSALHNPTGATLSPPTAFRLLSAATALGLLIVEDDIFADFETAPSPRLAVMDGLEHVIRIGSFSKTLSASVRCGYIAARKELIEGLVDLQVATSFGGPSPVITEVIADVLEGGSYRKHMLEIQRRLEKSRKTVTHRLGSLGISPWTVPKAGFYLWCRLPDGQDSTDIALRSMADKIIHAPGNVFSVSQSAASFMRFNVTQCEDERIFRSLGAILAKTIPCSSM
ncbi:PLP-dependent aminotransferase family protein [Gluconobacter albidus]|uniref:GntR family transcriptional regulator n=1 Tax=Gluconobacter albidus TaxID=318683 RepID=A0AAW3QUK3_9PROT|nr:PLP-dependent aminotransferase family protein [Gluconobacter albidus]KXV36946.1 GntR family transcriptional regulator [Gluconobacter albidus]MCP1274299.1 PLP-dependent aminotransferase family protein [Gluconobacter albidus]GBQ82617.1 transcriptional regulator [Gluconobacter albidus NBRC 3250]